jgi:hypothetical protein
MHKPRVLIVDRRAVMGTEVCRAVAAQGCVADVFAEPGSRAFRSRFCSGRFDSPPFNDPAEFRTALAGLVATTAYDAIHICHEEILFWLLPLLGRPEWKGLLHPPIERMKTALSKNSMLSVAEQAGVGVPRTAIPSDEREAADIAREFGFPVVIKGDTGESGETVRIVWKADDLLANYREVCEREERPDSRPAIQEFVQGPAYSIGGLYHGGRPLRVIVHRKLVRYPHPWGGRTVRGITEESPEACREGFKIFEALEYTGFGHVEFIRDQRDGRMKFLEVNPRLWGTIGVARHAGVDLFTPYRQLVAGIAVQPDLRFRSGVRFHRLLREIRLIREHPQRLLGFVVDSIDPRVRSDFMWSDPAPHMPAALFKRWLHGDHIRILASDAVGEKASTLEREFP